MSDLPDSGARRDFGTGAVREDDPAKPAIEGVSPFAMERLGLLFAAGGSKYGDYRNWEKGIPYMRFCAAILRHTYAWMRRDDNEDHMAAVMWNAQALMHFDSLSRSDLDDRPQWEPKATESHIHGAPLEESWDDPRETQEAPEGKTRLHLDQTGKNFVDIEANTKMTSSVLATHPTGEESDDATGHRH